MRERSVCVCVCDSHKCSDNCEEENVQVVVCIMSKGWSG